MIGRRFGAVLLVLTVLVSTFTNVDASNREASAGRRITLVARSTPAREVLLRIGAYFGASIVIRGNIERPVTVSLRALTLDEALAALLRPLGATYERDERLVTVTAPGEAPADGARSTATFGITAIPLSRAAAILRKLFPAARVVADDDSKTLIVSASASDVNAMRDVLQGIDVRNPAKPTAVAIPLHNVDPKTIVARLRALFPAAKIATGPERTLIVQADQDSQTQIKSLTDALDVPSASPSPGTSDAVRVTQVPANAVARLVTRAFQGLRANALGSTVVLSGAPDAVAGAKALIASIDVPQAQTRYTTLYRLRFVDVLAARNALAPAFPDARIDLDRDLNALSILATPPEQTRIAAALNQLDDPPSTPADGANLPGGSPQSGGGLTIDVVDLKSIFPAASANTPSSTPADIANVVLQTLSPSAPDLHVTPVPNEPQLVVSGSAYTVQLAKALIARLDIPQKLVVMDTQILEINETAAKNLGFSFGADTILTTTYSESTPQPNAAGQSPPLLGLQPLTRTPLSLQLQLGLAISQGKGRILADPRITTVSGKTASIRAGDNIVILTQAGGGTGVAVTTQLQTFQTGVNLDITPIVNDDDYIAINLHPVVNNVSSYSSAGIPQISTRDTQTTVGLREGQTLVIGGLIQSSNTRTTTKIPLLGDLPLLGPLFRNENVNDSQDELIITVTPHVLDPLKAGSMIPFPAPPPVPTTAPYREIKPAEAVASAPPTPIVAYGLNPLGAGAALSPVPQIPQAEPQTPLPAALGGTAAANAGPPAGPPPFPSPTPGTSVGTSVGAGAGAGGGAGAFGNTNVFTYGAPPANNYAGQSDAPQIFYATFSPTVLHSGTPVNLSVVTTTNVATVTIGYGNSTVGLASVGPGKWQSSYAFSTSAIPTNQPQVELSLSAARQDGTSTSIAIPVSVSQ